MTWQGGKRLRRLARGGGKSLFISYRREDTSGYAGRLFETLAAYVGRERLFMDVDTIRPGEDFLKVIEQTVGSSEAVIVLIGPRWLSAVDADGRPRLEDPEDFVRLEVKAALDRGLRVIPVLVDGATVPDREQLPSDLAALTRRHAVHLTHERWQTDVEHLVRSLGLKRRRPAWWLAAAAAVGLLAALGGFLAIRQTDQTPNAQERTEEEAVAADTASPAETASPVPTGELADKAPFLETASCDRFSGYPDALAEFHCRTDGIEARVYSWSSSAAFDEFTESIINAGMAAEAGAADEPGTWGCQQDLGTFFEYIDAGSKPVIYWTYDEDLVSLLAFRRLDAEWSRTSRESGELAEGLYKWWETNAVC